MAHDHETIIIDSDKHFVIDPVTRLISTESQKLKLMQYDHKSERYTFEIPRVIEGHDMSSCNKIRIHFQNSGSAGNHSDVYEVDDMKPSTDNPDILVFSWLIKNTCTQFAGTLGFAIRFYCILDDGTVDYSWGTELFSKITVSNGMENTEQIVEDYSDLISQIQKEIEDLKLNGGGDFKPKDFIVNATIKDGKKCADKTNEEIYQAYVEGRTILFNYMLSTFTLSGAALPNQAIFENNSLATMTRQTINIINDVLSLGGQKIMSNKNALGGVKANSATEEDTIPCNIDSNGFLKVSAQPKDLVVTGVSTQPETAGNPLSSTFEEIKEAINSGRSCYLLYNDSVRILLKIDGENISGANAYGLNVYSILIYPENTYDFQISAVRATGDNIGGFKAWNTDGTYHGIPIEIDPTTSFAYAALNISEKTETDTKYTVEVKIDPTTKKLYIPES